MINIEHLKINQILELDNRLGVDMLNKPNQTKI